MNFLFRALLSVKERKGKSIIIFLVMASICIFVLAGFSIESATNAASILARQKLGAKVTLSPNMEKIKEGMNREKENGFKLERTPISIEDVEKILTLDHIESYNVTSSTQAIADGFNPIKSTETNEENLDFPKEFGGKMNMGDLSIEGILELNVSNDFKDDNCKLIEGSSITSNHKEKKVAVIEETLAEQNDLKVGDKIKVTSTIDDEATLELEIIGIYKNNSEITDNAMRNDAMNPYNKIYVPYNIANMLKSDDYSGKVDSAIFYLDDPINVESFVEQGNELDIDYDKFILDADSRAYETMMGPIENVSSFAKTTVIIVSVAGAVILSLIIMLSIRERRNEIGILLSLGEKKAKIIAQLIVELLIVLSISLATSAIVGNSISNVISDKLIAREVLVTENMDQDNMRPEMGMRPDRGPNRGMSNVEVIDDLDVSVSLEDYAKMCSLAVLIVFIGVAMSSYGIMRLQPKEILSRHD